MTGLKNVHARHIVVRTTVIAALAIALSILAAGNDALAGDVALLTKIQRINWPGIASVVNFFNWYGNLIPLAVTAAFITAVLFARHRFPEAVLMLTAVILSGTANYGLKALFASSRPGAELTQSGEQVNGYGFPSGHTMSTFIFVGALLFLLFACVDLRFWHWIGLLCGLSIVLAMGFSRIYVGAHWPSDVLGAYLWGGFFLVAMIAAYQRITDPARSGLESSSSSDSRSPAD